MIECINLSILIFSLFPTKTTGLMIGYLVGYLCVFLLAVLPVELIPITTLLLIVFKLKS